MKAARNQCAIIVISLAVALGYVPGAKAVANLGLGGSIGFDPDGAGFAGISLASAFSFDPGNLLAVEAVPALLNFVNGVPNSFDTIVQARMSTAQGTFSVPAGTELTMVLKTRQTILAAVGGSPPPLVVTTVFAPGGANFLRLYFDDGSGRPASNANGLGFDDGSLILDASITANCVGMSGPTTTGSTLINTLSPSGTLDSSGSVIGNTSTSGLSGQASFCAIVTLVDTNFFQTPVGAVLFSTLLAAPFSAGNQASPMLDGTPANIGALNGFSGPDLLLESNSELTFAVPEPPVPALLGLGMVTMLGAGLRAAARAPGRGAVGARRS